MADATLKTMLQMLSGKIQALADNPGATAEDLAMLGFASEKIAGQVSAIEIEILAETQKTALNGLTDAKSAEIAQKVEAAIQAIDDLLDLRDTRFLGTANAAEIAFNDNVNTKTNQFNANASSKTTTFNNNATTRTNAVNTAGNDQVARVQAATGAAISTPTFADGDIAYNRRGFVTRWVSATGKTYSEITYDARDRITGWFETYTNAQGVIVRYRYAATYQAANLKTLIRTAVA